MYNDIVRKTFIMIQKGCRFVMKKAILFLLMLLMILTACSGNKPQEEVSMEDMMKISAWLLDDELEGTGKWGYIDPSTRSFPRKEDGNGYWIPDDGVTEVENEDVFEYDALEVGVPRTMAPMTFYMTRSDGNHIGYSNLNLRIDFDGIVKIKKVDPTDSSLRFRYTLNGPPIEADESVQLTGPCHIEVCPVGRVVVTEGRRTLIAQDTPVGDEYVFEIQGCSLGGDPIVTATLKLTTIPDPEYPWQNIVKGGYGELRQSNEERTRFCSIELVSYTYSEMYILAGEGGNFSR